MTTDKNAPQKKGLNKKRIIAANVLLFLVITGLLIWSIREYFHLGDKGYTEDAQVEVFINPINSKVQGYVREIHFTEHQDLKKGDTLVMLDNSEYLIQLAQAEAAYSNALAAKAATESGITTIINNIAVSDANIVASKARLNNLEKNYTRYRNLYAEKAVPKAELDQIESEYEALQAQIVSLERQKKTIQLSVKEAQNRLKMNLAQEKSAAAALDMAKLNVSYCTVTAPYDCTSGRRTLQTGQLIQPGQQLLTIVKNNEQWVVANFKEKQLPDIIIGRKVVLKIDALNGKEYEGVISAISEASGAKYSAVPVDNSTGNFVKVQQRFPVRIDFTNTNPAEDIKLLRAGMNVIVAVKD